MFLVVVVVIAVMSIILGAEQGPKADPTTTTYTPRPEWYFFFLFELLRVIKPAELTPLATIGIPTLCLVLLLLLPFYDRNKERDPRKRPVATTAGIMTIIAMALLTFLGAEAGPPTEIEMDVAPAIRGRQGRRRGPGLFDLPQDRRERRHPGTGADRTSARSCPPPESGERCSTRPGSCLRTRSCLPRSSTRSSSTSRRSADRARRHEPSPLAPRTSSPRRCGGCSTASPASTTS